MEPTKGVCRWSSKSGCIERPIRSSPLVSWMTGQTQQFHVSSGSCHFPGFIALLYCLLRRQEQVSEISRIKIAWWYFHYHVPVYVSVCWLSVALRLNLLAWLFRYSMTRKVSIKTFLDRPSTFFACRAMDCISVLKCFGASFIYRRNVAGA